MGVTVLQVKSHCINEAPLTWLYISVFSTSSEVYYFVNV